MGKLIVTVLSLCSMLLAGPIYDAVTSTNTVAKDPQSVSNWFETLSTRSQNITRFHYYFHDTVSGSNPTSVFVASANSTASSPTLFGIVGVADDPLTVGPELNSTLVGRAQGIYASSQLTGGIALFMSMNIVFTQGEYNGSTLSMFGQNPIVEPYRELSIIGGTGVFRLARGIATANTISFNPTTNDAVVEYNVVVTHYN